MTPFAALDAVIRAHAIVETTLDLALFFGPGLLLAFAIWVIWQTWTRWRDQHESRAAVAEIRRLGALIAEAQQPVADTTNRKETP
ncbi:hypothetical protein ACIOEX_01265 [Streptomyces sp. NPDC087850]|uniref:hypothetical protein n=1 Tax=Streptomyces sp. NPDC087850 TaxID=3365809 RepID=UPI0037FCC1EC